MPAAETFDDLPNFSDGHRRCMRLILAEVRKIRTPFQGLPLVIGHENDDQSIMVLVTNERDVRIGYAGREDLMLAVDIAAKRSLNLVAPVIVLAIDLAGICVQTCVECAPVNVGQLGVS